MSFKEIFDRKRKIEDVTKPIADVITKRELYEEKKADVAQLSALDVALYGRFISTRAEFYRNHITPLFSQTLGSLAEALQKSGANNVQGPTVTPSGLVTLEWDYSDTVTFNFSYNTNLEGNNGEFIHLYAETHHRYGAHHDKVVRITSGRKRPYLHFSEDENRAFFITINNSIAKFLKKNLVHKDGKIQVSSKRIHL